MNKITGINFKVVGVTFANPNGINRQVLIAGMNNDSTVFLKREPNNVYDANAVAVYYIDQQIGYVSKEFAKILAPMMDQGRKFNARVKEVGCYNGTHYCHIIVDEE